MSAKTNKLKKKKKIEEKKKAEKSSFYSFNIKTGQIF